MRALLDEYNELENNKNIKEGTLNYTKHDSQNDGINNFNKYLKYIDDI
jgi:hypothetical protein